METMRRFNSFERRIIEKILRIDEMPGFNVLQNILDIRECILSKGSHYIEVPPSSVSLIRIEQQHFNAASSTPTGPDSIKYLVEQTGKEMIFAAKLLEYLETKSLIYAYTAPPPPTTVIGQQQSGTGVSYIHGPSLAPEIDALLRKCINQVFVPTPSLYKLRDNEYLGDEEVRFQKNMAWTRAAVVFSAVAAFAASAAVFVEVKSGSDKKIDPAIQTSVDSIKTSMEKMAKEMGGMESSLQRLPAPPALRHREPLQTNSPTIPTKP